MSALSLDKFVHSLVYFLDGQIELLIEKGASARAQRRPFANPETGKKGSRRSVSIVPVAQSR